MVEKSTCNWVISYFHGNPLDGKHTIVSYTSPRSYNTQYSVQSELEPLAAYSPYLTSQRSCPLVGGGGGGGGGRQLHVAATLATAWYPNTNSEKDASHFCSVCIRPSSSLKFVCLTPLQPLYPIFVSLSVSMYHRY